MSAEPDTERPVAPFGRRWVTVLANRRVGSYHVLEVVEQSSAPAPWGGQFYMLACVRGWGGGEQERPFLARACSVLRLAQDGGGPRTLEFLLEDVGPGTAHLCALVEGDAMWLLGPLGRGFTGPDPPRPAVLAGGGVGVAPLAIWQDVLRSRGVEQRALVGFRDGPHAAAAALLNDPRVATDDGSVGHHGVVTELLERELEREPSAVVYACGPPPMLEAVRALCERRDVDAQLALEAGMACGFGACFGCVVPVRDGGYLRVCVDGPVVDARRLHRVAEPGHV